MKLQKPKHITTQQNEVAKKKAIHHINMLFALIEIIDHNHTELQENLKKIHANPFYFKKQINIINKQIKWFRDFAINAFGSEQQAEGFFELTDQIHQAIEKEITKQEKIEKI